MEFNDSGNDKSVCIIGAGMSGLVSGMRLAKAGFKVILCPTVGESEEKG